MNLVESVSAVEDKTGTLLPIKSSAIAKPGDRLRYTIVAINSGDRPAKDLVPLVHLPAGERFVGGSAGELAEYSIDGGKTWSRAPLVRVAARDGTPTTRAALPREYNAIRWIVPSPLASGAQATFSYDVVIE